MKYMLLSVVVLLLIVEPCNSFSLVVDNLLAHPYSPYLLGGLGTAVCILPACYIFYPAYANVEGGLGCTSTVLAGNDNKNNRGKSISYDAPTFTGHCMNVFFLINAYNCLLIAPTNIIQTIYFHLLFLPTMRQIVCQSCLMLRLNI